MPNRLIWSCLITCAVHGKQALVHACYGKNKIYIFRWDASDVIFDGKRMRKKLFKKPPTNKSYHESRVAVVRLVWKRTRILTTRIRRGCTYCDMSRRAYDVRLDVFLLFRRNFSYRRQVHDAAVTADTRLLIGTEER